MCPRDVHLLRAKLYFVFGGWCIGLSSARRSTPLGVPTDLQSVVKKVRPIMPGDLQSPYPIDMLANAWVLGIANPQSIKRLGHFLTADCKSAGTPNGGRAYPALRTPNGHIRRYGGYGLKHFLASHEIFAAPLPLCPFSFTPFGESNCIFPAIVFASESRKALLT